MHQKQHDDVFEAAADRVERDPAARKFFDRQVAFEVKGRFLLALISQLQLSLRHPQNLGASAGLMRHFIYSARQEMPPILQQVVDAGFDDVPNFSTIGTPPIQTPASDLYRKREGSQAHGD